jgi:hypothetical protein
MVMMAMLSRLAAKKYPLSTFLLIASGASPPVSCRQTSVLPAPGPPVTTTGVRRMKGFHQRLFASSAPAGSLIRATASSQFGMGSRS